MGIQLQINILFLIFLVRPTDVNLDPTVLKLTFQKPPQMGHPGFSHFYIETKSQESANWDKEVTGELWMCVMT